MKHYLVKIIDGYSEEPVYLHFYGKLDKVEIRGRIYKCICNDFDTPIFIEGLNTVSITEYKIFE